MNGSVFIIATKVMATFLPWNCVTVDHAAAPQREVAGDDGAPSEVSRLKRSMLRGKACPYKTRKQQFLLYTQIHSIGGNTQEQRRKQWTFKRRLRQFYTLVYYGHFHYSWKHHGHCHCYHDQSLRSYLLSIWLTQYDAIMNHCCQSSLRLLPVFLMFNWVDI